MACLYLIGDESCTLGEGAPTQPGEFGLIGGILLHNGNHAAVSAEMARISSLFPSAQKVHMRALSVGDQQTLRAKTFAALASHSAVCVYEAGYVEGFRQANERLRKMVMAAKAGRRSSIKVSGNTPRESMRARLFEGVVGVSVAWGADHLGDDFDLKVILDPVDVAIRKEYERIAAELLNATGTFQQLISGYDMSNGKVVTGSIQIIQTSTSELPALPRVRFSLAASGGDPLTIAADVISNSVQYYIRQNVDLARHEPLNRSQAIQGHPLQGLFYGFHPLSLADTEFAPR